jgi:hypothetical protein
VRNQFNDIYTLYAAQEQIEALACVELSRRRRLLPDRGEVQDKARQPLGPSSAFQQIQVFQKPDQERAHRLGLLLLHPMVSVVTPGNRILRSTRRAVARSNKTLGRSALSHARVYSHCTSRKCSG